MTRVYDTTDGRLFFDPDGNGSAPRQLIAILTGHPSSPPTMSSSSEPGDIGS